MQWTSRIFQLQYLYSHSITILIITRSQHLHSMTITPITIYKCHCIISPRGYAVVFNLMCRIVSSQIVCCVVFLHYHSFPSDCALLHYDSFRLDCAFCCDFTSYYSKIFLFTSASLIYNKSTNITIISCVLCCVFTLS